MGGVTAPRGRHLPPLADAVDAALRHALASGALPFDCAPGDVRRIVEIVFDAVSARRPRLLEDPGRVRAGYALRERDRRIRALRGKATAAALAQRFGISQRQVNRILARRET